MSGATLSQSEHVQETCVHSTSLSPFPTTSQSIARCSQEARIDLIVLIVALYGLELLNGFQLLAAPSQVGIVYGLVSYLIGAFALGLIRAWELLGAHRYGLLGWLSPLCDVQGSESFARAGNSQAAVEHPPTEEATVLAT